ncbi:YceD family protein [Desulfotomaculum copahuensis]|uniref:Metal-binding protein n=1 Tax=Desulfotomaculum copahuensis TaxID=1838280 RepID=A0A1B7LE05_9FIRM|nr:DUF177 domain-containing protein [Desulfotomaculum copahuensis]OAT81329.1 metal-binding protein [Desulfotomaculum copahuensis]
MQIDVSTIKQSPGMTLHRELEAPLPALEGAGEIISFVGPARAVLDLTNSGGLLELTGGIQAALQLSCARCLENFVYPVDVPLRELYYPAGAVEPPPEQREEGIPFRGDKLDITPEVLKSILLALPMKAVCRPDCRGLCPVCGQNLNRGRCNCRQEEVDPRLAVLKDLFKH